MNAQTDLTALFVASRTAGWTARDLKAMERSLKTNGARGDKAEAVYLDVGICVHNGKGV